MTVKSVAKLCETTKPTASKAIESLCSEGILAETSGRRRDRTYTYGRYLELLKVGTEVALHADAGGPKLPSLRGKVYTVAAAAEGKARTFRVEIRLEDKSGRWRPGMTARLEVPGDATR